MVSVHVVDIDRTSETPTYRQVANILRERIRSGELKSGDQLPSVHSLVKRRDSLTRRSAPPSGCSRTKAW
jgi:hypothetical protein